MTGSVLTVNQMRACLILASEQIRGDETGSKEPERLKQICNQYDAEYNLQLHDLAGQLVTFGAMICNSKK